MGFLSSIFKRRNAAAAASEPVDEVQRARRRARQRLIGAFVLLTIGVVGFPLVFETQPRPIPVDIPIEIPRKDGLPPLVAPASRALAATAAPASSDGAGPPSPSSGSPSPEMITESREDAGRDSVSTAVPLPPRSSTPGASRPAATIKPTPRTGSAPRPEQSLPAGKPDTGGDGARARALLDGKASVGAASDAAAGAAARFIVQVGAFADANAAHETRLKIEKLGLKTYTQVASTPAGDRIRVRVGPFPSRDEADKALAKARSAGLSAVMLTL